MEIALVPKKSAQILHEAATLIADLRTLGILAKENRVHCRYDGEYSPIIVEMQTGCSDTDYSERKIIKRAFFDRFENDEIALEDTNTHCIAFKIGPTKAYALGRQVSLLEE